MDAAGEGDTVFQSGKLKELTANLAVSFVAILVTLAALELVVFRCILMPDDLLRNVTVDGVVRYQPETKATFRHPDGRATRVTINKDGWNSTKSDYVRAKAPGVTRIAVIGDSYVHGTFTHVEDGFPARLEARLKSNGHNVEVYRFGMDGAPLSQYLQMLRQEVVAFSPDIVVVPLIHNDFDESYRFIKTRYASSFLKLRRDADGSIQEVPPAEFRPGLADKLRQFATFRYLYYETGLYLSAKGIVSRIFWGGNEEWSPEFISSAVDIRKIADHDANRDFARYALEKMKALSRKHGFQLAFVMDGVRDAINQGRPKDDFEVARLNQIAAELTHVLGLPFRDLHEAFKSHVLKTGERLEFKYDWHWTKKANDIVADQIADLIAPALPRFSQPTVSAVETDGRPTWDGG